MSADAPEHFNMHEAKTQLSRIIERVERGEEIVIDRAGRPVAKIIPLGATVDRSGIGSLSGQVEFSADWDSDETNDRIADGFGIPS